MFMCEFAKDLMHRLTSRNIFFRAVITQGNFRHYQLNDVPCFYGPALIEAYEAEKNIKAIGLFIHKKLSRYSDIFKSCHFSNDFDFVFVTQALDEIESLSPPTPHGSYIDDRELNWNGGPELLHLVDLLRGERSDLPNAVTLKYKNSVELYRKQYPKILACLESNNLTISSIAPTAAWQPVIERHPQDCSYAIKRRMEI